MVVETGDKTCPSCNGELHQISEDKRAAGAKASMSPKCHSRLMRRSNQHG
jgi:hypothetical protein